MAIFFSHQPRSFLLLIFFALPNSDQWRNNALTTKKNAPNSKLIHEPHFSAPQRPKMSSAMVDKSFNDPAQKSKNNIYISNKQTVEKGDVPGEVGGRRRKTNYTHTYVHMLGNAHLSTLHLKSY